MGRKIFSCDFDGCNRAFSRPDDYARHRRATHGSQRGRYICGEDATHAGFGCGRRFNRRDVLQQHRRTTKAQTICVHRRYTPDSSSSPCMEENEHTEPAPDEENPEPFLYQLDPAILDSSRSNPLLLTEEDRSNIVDIWARCSSPSSESHPTMTTTPSTPLDSGSIPSRLRPGQVVGGYYELGNTTVFSLCKNLECLSLEVHVRLLLNALQDLQLMFSQKHSIPKTKPAWSSSDHGPVEKFHRSKPSNFWL